MRAASGRAIIRRRTGQPSVNIVSEYKSFRRQSDGSILPDSIKLTAETENVGEPTYEWFVVGVNESGGRKWVKIENSNSNTYNVSPPELNADGEEAWTKKTFKVTVTNISQAVVVSDSVIIEVEEPIEVGGVNLLTRDNWEQGSLNKQAPEDSSYSNLKIDNESTTVIRVINLVSVGYNHVYSIGNTDYEYAYVNFIGTRGGGPTYQGTDYFSDWLTKSSFVRRPRSGNNYVAVLLRRVDGGAITVNDFEKSKLKLENGTVDTDWTPAPSDGWIKYDPATDTLYVEKSFYSLGGISALGLGEGGGGSSGGGVDMLDSWTNYTEAKADFYAPASLLVPFRDYTLSRLESLESGGGAIDIDIVTTGDGNAITSISKDGTEITANKDSKFAELGTDGFVLTSQLPSYVDDVLEFDTLANFPTTGESGKIYVTIDTSLTYRWTGTTYVEISKSIALGETDSTAFRGDHGSIAYEHSQEAHAPSNAQKNSDITKTEIEVKLTGDITTHTHSQYSYTAGTGLTLTERVFTPTFGTTKGTVAQGNDSRILNGQTAFEWGNHSSEGYALNSALTAHINNDDNPHAVTKLQVGLGNVDDTSDADKPISTATQNALDAHFLNDTDNAKHLTDAQLAYLNNLIGWWKVDTSGNLYTEKNLYSTKGVSALGLGEGGGSSGGGGVDMLDSWTNYTEAKANFYAPASLLVPFRDYTLSRLESLEAGGGAIDIEIVTNGNGNAITSISKDGNTITASKDSSFAPSAHTHTIANITDLGNIATINKNNSTANYLRGDGTWVTPPNTNTTYSAMSVEEGEEGTATSSRTVRADYLKEIIQHYDTNSVTGIRAGASGTNANSSTSNPYIKVLDDSTYRSQIRLSGDGATSVSSDASGNITISSTNTNTTYSAGNGISLSSTTFSVAGGNGLVQETSGLALGKPSTITSSTTNSVGEDSHTHALTVTKADVGLGNVTNESKATMFTNPTFTGTVKGVTKSHVGLGNVDDVKQATKSEFDTHTGNATVHITATERTNWNDAFSERHEHVNKDVIDELTQENINVLNYFSVVDGNIKVDTTLWATGGVSALGLGEGGGSSGGGGVDMLDAWANYTTAKANYYVPSSLLVSFRDYTLDRLSTIEGGSASAIATTGTGNAITSVSKDGDTLIFEKGNTFSLSTHTHKWAQITDKPETFAPSAHSHGNISNDGKIGATKNLMIQTSTGGVLVAKPAGTTAQYLRGDGAWATPPNTNTTYSAGSGLTLSGTQFSLPVTALGSGTFVKSVTQGDDGISVEFGTPPNTNTTYSAMSVEEGEEGTATSSRTVRADYLKEIIQHYDTNSVTGIRAGASGTATNATTTNPYIKVTDDGTHREQIRLLGGGATTVKSDASGNVTISSTNTVYTHPNYTAYASGLYKITTNTLGHVTGATAVVKADITDLGIPAQDTVYTHPIGDGNKHVPKTGTDNDGKVLKAGATAGSISWGTLSYSDVGAASSDHTHSNMVTTNTTQTITGTKTFSKLLTASAGLNTTTLSASGIITANLGIKIGTHSTDGLIEWDATNKAFKFNGSLYATGGISALGLGEGGGSSGGGGGVDMLDSWENYTSSKANYYVPSSLLVSFRNDTLSRLSTHTHTFASLTNKPTTLSGYGITALDVKNTAGLNSDTVAIGESVNAAPYSVAIGASSQSGSNSVALGSYVTAGEFSVAIGTLATAGDFEGVLGDANFTNKWIIPGNLAIGKNTSATSALDVNGVIKATGGSSTNWNTAYGWGNHADKNYLTSNTETKYTAGTNVQISAANVISATDTKYTLPVATATVRGGVELFSNTVQSVAANAVTTTASRTYGIQLNSAGQAVVNVPWSNTNTTYSAGTGLSLSGTTFGQAITTSSSGSFVTGITQTANGFQVNLGTPPNTNTTYTAGTNVQISAANVISATDTKYTLPVATATVRGGVELFSNTVQSVAANAVTTTASRTYGIQLNSAGQAVVNVPWSNTNTKYTAGTNIQISAANVISATDTIVDISGKVDKITGKGLSTNDYTSAEKVKLNKIEEGANKYTHPNYTARTSGLYKITVNTLGHISAATAVAKSDITALGIPAQDTVYTHPNYTARTSGLYKITVNTLGHISAATAVAKSDITALGIPAQDTVYTHPSSHPASMITGLHASATTGVAGSVAWGNVTGKPSTFEPSTHNHSASNITSGTLPIARGGTGNTTGLAASATVLATSRTINGTSFNGSANITTARWGTARTLTIGSTGKSVNGSANVSWSLAEIGAAAGDNVSYKHDAGSGARWVRIAEFSTYTSYGIISILNSYSNNAPNSVTFHYNSGYRSASSPSITQIGGRAGIFTKARVVYPTATNVPGFIEVYYNTTSVGNTLYLRLTNSFNCTLLRTATVGSVPSTHTSYERSFTNGGISADTVSANTFYGSLSGNATTATTLATARNINGTSFNGSAAITTARWGTARNIGVVNSDGTGTAVVTSVNGSGNVNLKLPSTIKATLSGNASTATTLQTARNINGVLFDGSRNITITASTTATLTRGSYLTGSNFNGSTARTWAVDATSANTANKVVARNSSGNFSAGTITASLSGNASSASTVLTSAENTGDTSRFILFANSASGNQALKTDSGLKYVPTTNTITATLAGNASSATTAANCSRSVLAGNGLTGGGALSANRTLTLGTPSNITLSSTNSVATDSHTHNLALGGTASQYLNGATTLKTIPTITAGNGLTGGGQLTATRTLTLGTPSTLTAASTNKVEAESHTHAITTTSVGAASTIVQTNASGGTKLSNLMINNWSLLTETSDTVFAIKYGDAHKMRITTSGGGGVDFYGNLFIQDNLTAGRIISENDITTYELEAYETVITPKVDFGNGFTIEPSGSQLVFKYNGVIKQRMLPDGTILATAGITALST